MAKAAKKLGRMAAAKSICDEVVQRMSARSK